MMFQADPSQPPAGDPGAGGFPPLAPVASSGSAAPAPSEGTPLAIGPLIVAHHAALYRYAFRLSGCQADAEDLTQQTFLVAQRKIHQLRDPARVGSWLYAVLRSCYLKQCRKRPALAASALQLPLEEIAAEETADDSIDREELQTALGELPDEYRLVVLMFYFEELSYKEIAEQLEIPIGTVMSRLSRAKGHLRARLAGEAAAPSARPSRLGLKPSRAGLQPTAAEQERIFRRAT